MIYKKREKVSGMIGKTLIILNSLQNKNKISHKCFKTSRQLNAGKKIIN